MSGDRKLIGWKAWYYIDNQIKVYSSKDYSWDKIPQQDFQILIRYFDDGSRDIDNGADVYILNNELALEVIKLSKSIKFGKYIDSEAFTKIHKMAFDDLIL